MVHISVHLLNIVLEDLAKAVRKETQRDQDGRGIICRWSDSKQQQTLNAPPENG